MQVVSSQLDTLTEQQKSAVSGLRQSSQQAEDALSQGLERLQETLSETLTCDPSGTPGVTNYMEQMANAMGKLEALVSFVTQCRTYEYVNKTRFYWLNRTITGSQNNMPTDSLENGKPIAANQLAKEIDICNLVTINHPGALLPGIYSALNLEKVP
ncbi:hypothetical protein MUK42_13421 [Musa troglodytarum]|uniref:Uncharacterized protein n=1 Tax=Musa troglodytarum TaxID=320322 RepID=A0A9E7GP82_9LILI|nr:hypothetical protein MUK42_13421 [Musa troglodytarum]